jgi:hypothetical protein
MEAELRRKRLSLILAGFLVPSLLIAFLMGFLYPAFVAVDRYSPDVSLILLGLIFINTAAGATASYFWSQAGLSLNLGRRMALGNAMPLWVLFLTHPFFGQQVFFIVLSLIILLITAPLGVWFGKRVLFE